MVERTRVPRTERPSAAAIRADAPATYHTSIA